MTYFLLLMILFNRPGEITDIFHIDTIQGQEQCITEMNRLRDEPGHQRGTWFSCVPLKVSVNKTNDKESA